MPAGNESWSEPRANQGDATAVHPRTAPQRRHSERASRPWTLGLIGLAIAVALWGFGYKLSRYSLHSDFSSRASFAKLWDKHEDSAQVAETVKLAPQSNLSFEWRAILTLPEDKPVLERQALCHSDESKFISPWSRSLLPLRSPPSRTFLA